MKMIKTLALVGAMVAGSSAMAGTISGTLQFASPFPSVVTLSPTGPFTGVTTVDFSNQNAVVSGATLDFLTAGLGGAAAVFKDFTVGTAVDDLWTAGGYTFDLDTSANVSNGATPQFLSITGTGTIYGPLGVDATPGSFTFQVTDSTGGGAGPALTFAFTASTNSVPDGGATAILLGVGLLGLGALRRKA